MYLLEWRHAQRGTCERKTLAINFGRNNSGMHQGADGTRTVLCVQGLGVNVGDRNKANDQN